MKQILFFVMVVFAFTACKTTKQQPQSQYTTDTTAQPKVFSVPGSETQTATETVATTPNENPISTKKEQVTFTQPEDRTGNESNSFFVIIGSFSQLDNAKNFRETLLDEGFTPIILHSETGYYRVCVNSYKNENEARIRIRELRQAFPKYADVWLLIKE
ncbi:MAG: SPOR domain-containing protein [Prolixibacteraceae bacterium]|nr:SPOR domain-containing protein [Prolixibacteraceae bacterium]